MSLPTTSGETVGPDVAQLGVGDEVMAAVAPMRAEDGARATFVAVPAASVVAKLDGLSLPEAAKLPMNGLTASTR